MVRTAVEISAVGNAKANVAGTNATDKSVRTSASARRVAKNAVRTLHILNVLTIVKVPSAAWIALVTAAPTSAVIQAQAQTGIRSAANDVQGINVLTVAMATSVERSATVRGVRTDVEAHNVGASAQAAWAGNVPMDAKVLFVENHQRVPPQLTLALAANVANTATERTARVSALVAASVALNAGGTRARVSAVAHCAALSATTISAPKGVLATSVDVFVKGTSALRVANPIQTITL